LRLGRRLGEIAVRIPLLGGWASRLRERIRRFRLPPAVAPAGDKAAVGRLSAAAAIFKTAPEPVILLVSHALGGGTERHLADLVARVGDRAGFLRLQPGRDGARLWVPRRPDLPAIGFSNAELPELVEWLASFGVDRVHVHHWIGLEIEIRAIVDALGVPFDFTVHDYYSICPRINLMQTPESGYCGEPDAAGCNACLAADERPGLTDITTWRLDHGWLLGKAERVICPSEDVRRRLARYAPGARFLVVPHEPVEAGTWRVVPRRPTAGEPLRIGLLGVVAKHKGLDLLAAAAAFLDPGVVEFVVIGFCEPPLPIRLQGLVRETGRYQEVDLPRLIAAAGVHALWFPAVCPETYSYTLSAAIAAELPIVAPVLGAFAERLAGRPLTWIVPPPVDGPALAGLFAGVRDRLAAASSAPLAGERARVGPDFYASGYVLPRGGQSRCRPDDGGRT